MRKKSKIKIRIRRHKRIRAKIFGTAKMPRLFVFRSNKHIYAQMINDEKSCTLVSTGDLELTAKSKKLKTKRKKPSSAKATDGKEEKRTGKIAIAYEVGKLIAKKAQEKKIKKVVFDRGGYKYHGRVKALAQGARDGGLKF